MKAAVFKGRGKVACEEVKRPVPGPEDILVRVRACGLCGTDVHKITHATVPAGSILGHEISGDVVEAGSGAGNIRTGDRVAVTHHCPCFVCRTCRKGHHTLCKDFKKLNIDPGGFAEFVRVTGDGVRKGTMTLPSGVEYEEAIFAETAGCCLRGLRRCNIMSGDTVAVVGCGPVGILHIQLARFLGAGCVIGIDPEPLRLAAAARFGADCGVRPEDAGGASEKWSGRKVDCAVVAAGSAKAVEKAIEIVSGGGTVLVFAECPPGETFSMEANRVYREVSLVGSYSSTPLEQAEALDLIAGGKIRVAGMVSHRFGLEQVEQAVETARSAKEALKVVIRPGE